MTDCELPGASIRMADILRLPGMWICGLAALLGLNKSHPHSTLAPAMIQKLAFAFVGLRYTAVVTVAVHCDSQHIWSLPPKANVGPSIQATHPSKMMDKVCYRVPNRARVFQKSSHLA